jgi:hypothetical protein
MRKAMLHCHLLLTLMLSLALHGEPAAAQVASGPVPASSAASSGLGSNLSLRRAEPAPAAGTSWAPAAVTLTVLLGAGALFLRRRGAGKLFQKWKEERTCRDLVRLSSHPLTAHASVHALRWNGEELLVGCTSQQVTLLARQPMPADPGELT